MYPQFYYNISLVLGNCLLLILLLSRDRSLSLSVFLLILECRHGCSASRVFHGGTMSGDSIYLLGWCVNS